MAMDLGIKSVGYFVGSFRLRFQWLLSHSILIVMGVTLECKVLGYDVCCDGIMEHCQITGTSFGSCFLSDVFSATNCGRY